MTAPITWPAFVEATDRLREAANALARLIADTLAVQYDGAAAYLVLEEDDCCDVMTVLSVLDAEGLALYTFDDAGTRLPALPQGSPLTAAWRHLDPADPVTLFKAVQGLYQAGSLFDLLPYDLPRAAEPTAPEDSHCLLLSTAEYPDSWDFDDVYASRLVRPYCAPRPATSKQSPPHRLHPALPGLTATDDIDTVINWGLGADSSAYLAKMLPTLFCGTR